MKKTYGTMETSLNRYQTFKRAYSRLGIAAIIMSATALAGVSAGWWAMTRVEPPKYFIAREDGGIIPIVPVEQPYLTDGEILNFGVEAITTALTMSFANYRTDLAKASEYFERPSGWNNFIEALESSNTLNFIRDRRLITSVIANGAMITRTGVSNGRYNWVVQIPITITYQSSSERTQENRLAEIQITRLPTWQTARGIGITRVLLN